MKPLVNDSSRALAACGASVSTKTGSGAEPRLSSAPTIGFPLHQILEERGFEIYLVNAHYLKNVPGRKSDASDCQWIQYLHSVGLLRASFRPPAEICAVRSL